MKPPSSCYISQKLAFSPYIFVFLALLLFVSICQVEDLSYLYSLKDLEYTTRKQPVSTIVKSRGNKLPFAIGEAAKKCDAFSGRWVHDYTRPLYEEDDCPYIIPQLTCIEHGRPDKDYQHWRWQPNDCSLPSFNATLMLESLRGKTMLFVGDSLNRGQFISMVCLLHRIIPEHAKSMEATFDSLSVFIAKDYNATIGFYWAPYLLESNSDNPTNHKLAGSVVRSNSINVHGQHWKGADIIVFNTYLWWMSDIKMLYVFITKDLEHIFVMKNEQLRLASSCFWFCYPFDRRGSFEDEVKEIVGVPRDDAYRIAISSLVQWINENVDPDKTRVFFRTASPAHKTSRNWGGKANGNCYSETSMLENETNSGVVNSIMEIIAEELNKSRVAITVLNVTHLSYVRKEAHTSIYKAQWRNLTAGQLANPSSYADCIHWCLPGVQDVWNELLFSKLFYP